MGARSTGGHEKIMTTTTGASANRADEEEERGGGCVLCFLSLASHQSCGAYRNDY